MSPPLEGTCTVSQNVPSGLTVSIDMGARSQPRLGPFALRSQTFASCNSLSVCARWAHAQNGGKGWKKKSKMSNILLSKCLLAGCGSHILKLASPQIGKCQIIHKILLWQEHGLWYPCMCEKCYWTFDWVIMDIFVGYIGLVIGCQKEYH